MNKHREEAKNYLSKAFCLDQRIESKLDQIEVLKSLATKVTVTYSEMPRDTNKGSSRIEETVLKIIFLEDEVKQDIDELLDLKKDIMHRIKEVENPELQVVLELRYVSYYEWEEVARKLGYGIDNVYCLHRKALDKIKIPDTLQ